MLLAGYIPPHIYFPRAFRLPVSVALINSGWTAAMRETSGLEIATCNSPLLLLPPELIIRILCFLPSFSDVFAVASASRQLRSVWSENTTSVYRKLAPTNIPCERHARSFIAGRNTDTKGISTLSAHDVACLVRNSHVVEKAIKQFEKEVVCRVRGTFCAVSRSFAR